ncbi:MAG: TetR/AcrR family transcriptional regulator [Candidatus Lokiarchaeota archaeon]|nr:TetR/AcrR family transcriptional regulator [Candidatus Lokiarchaeota archaeon]
MNPKLKQTRARSEDKKEEQFERILDAGKKLFLEKGTEGFSMRNLAEMLGMTKNNLYNYIESKRELWIAIRNKFYSQFKEENLKIIKKHEGSTCNLILKLYEHFLEFADKDYDRFKMMFNVIEAPHSNNVPGPIERNYAEYRLLEGTTNIIQRAIDEGEIELEEGKASFLSLFIYSLFMGVAYIEMNRAVMFAKIEKIKQMKKEEEVDDNLVKVEETLQLTKVEMSNESLRNYTLEILEKILKNNSL